MKKSKKVSEDLKALKFAFQKTLPILAGFLFLGASYGFYMRASGFSFIYPIIMATVIFGGSLEFVAVTMLMSSFAPLQTFTAALMIQARHLFYGIAMLEKYKGTGIKKPYLIFGLCDETFSINCSTEVPKDIDEGKFMFFVTLLNQLYWICGASLGGLLGSFINFNTEGIEFVMTALFTVIFIEQWLKQKERISGIIGVLSSLICLALFGAESFLLPTMLCIVCFLSLLRGPIEKAGGEK